MRTSFFQSVFKKPSRSYASEAAYPWTDEHAHPHAQQRQFTDPSQLPYYSPHGLNSSDLGVGSSRRRGPPSVFSDDSRHTEPVGGYTSRGRRSEDGRGRGAAAVGGASRQRSRSLSGKSSTSPKHTPGSLFDGDVPPLPPLPREYFPPQPTPPADAGAPSSRTTSSRKPSQSKRASMDGHRAAASPSAHHRHSLPARPRGQDVPSPLFHVHAPPPLGVVPEDDSAGYTAYPRAASPPAVLRPTSPPAAARRPMSPPATTRRPMSPPATGKSRAMSPPPTAGAKRPTSPPAVHRPTSPLHSPKASPARAEPSPSRTFPSLTLAVAPASSLTPAEQDRPLRSPTSPRAVTFAPTVQYSEPPVVYSDEDDEGDGEGSYYDSESSHADSVHSESTERAVPVGPERQETKPEPGAGAERAPVERVPVAEPAEPAPVERASGPAPKLAPEPGSAPASATASKPTPAPAPAPASAPTPAQATLTKATHPSALTPAPAPAPQPAQPRVMPVAVAAAMQAAALAEASEAVRAAPSVARKRTPSPPVQVGKPVASESDTSPPAVPPRSPARGARAPRRDSLSQSPESPTFSRAMLNGVAGSSSAATPAPERKRRSKPRRPRMTRQEPYDSESHSSSSCRSSAEDSPPASPRQGRLTPAREEDEDCVPSVPGLSPIASGTPGAAPRTHAYVTPTGSDLSNANSTSSGSVPDTVLASPVSAMLAGTRDTTTKRSSYADALEEHAARYGARDNVYDDAMSEKSVYFTPRSSLYFDTEDDGAALDLDKMMAALDGAGGSDNSTTDHEHDKTMPGQYEDEAGAFGRYDTEFEDAEAGDDSDSVYSEGETPAAQVTDLPSFQLQPPTPAAVSDAVESPFRDVDDSPYDTLLSPDDALRPVDAVEAPAADDDDDADDVVADDEGDEPSYPAPARIRSSSPAYTPPYTAGADDDAITPKWYEPAPEERKAALRRRPKADDDDAPLKPVRSRSLSKREPRAEPSEDRAKPVTRSHSFSHRAREPERELPRSRTMSQRDFDDASAPSSSRPSSRAASRREPALEDVAEEVPPPLPPKPKMDRRGRVTGAVVQVIGSSPAAPPAAATTANGKSRAAMLVDDYTLHRSKSNKSLRSVKSTKSGRSERTVTAERAPSRPTTPARAASRPTTPASERPLTPSVRRESSRRVKSPEPQPRSRPASALRRSSIHERPESRHSSRPPSAMDEYPGGGGGGSDVSSYRSESGVRAAGYGKGGWAAASAEPVKMFVPSDGGDGWAAFQPLPPRSRATPLPGATSRSSSFDYGARSSGSAASSSLGPSASASAAGSWHGSYGRAGAHAMSPPPSVHHAVSPPRHVVSPPPGPPRHVVSPPPGPPPHPPRHVVSPPSSVSGRRASAGLPHPSQFADHPDEERPSRSYLPDGVTGGRYTPPESDVGVDAYDHRTDIMSEPSEHWDYASERPSAAPSTNGSPQKYDGAGHVRRWAVNSYNPYADSRMDMAPVPPRMLPPPPPSSHASSMYSSPSSYSQRSAQTPRPTTNGFDQPPYPAMAASSLSPYDQAARAHAARLGLASSLNPNVLTVLPEMSVHDSNKLYVEQHAHGHDKFPASASEYGARGELRRSRSLFGSRRNSKSRAASDFGAGYGHHPGSDSYARSESVHTHGEWSGHSGYNSIDGRSVRDKHRISLDTPGVSTPGDYGYIVSDGTGTARQDGYTNLVLPRSGVMKPGDTKHVGKTNLQLLGLPDSSMAAITLSSALHRYHLNVESPTPAHLRYTLPPPVDFSTVPPPHKPSKSQVLVQVYAVAVDWLDIAALDDKTRHDVGRWVPGRSFVGRVVTTGDEEGVIQRGELVVGLENIRRSGALVEYFAIDRRRVARVNPNTSLSVEELAALPSQGIAVHRAISDVGVRRGQQAFIMDPYEGLPALLCQEMTRMGVAVTAYVGGRGGDEDMAAAQQACMAYGARGVMSGSSPASVLNSLQEGMFDVVVDTRGGPAVAEAARRALVDGGHILTLVNPGASADASSPSSTPPRHSNFKAFKYAMSGGGRKKKHVVTAYIHPAGAGDAAVDKSGLDYRDVLEERILGVLHPVVTDVVPFERGAELFRSRRNLDVMRVGVVRMVN